MEQWAPRAYALPHDPIGLHVGDPQWHVTHVLTALDVTQDVVAEAISVGAQLIVAHHPLWFRPLSAVRLDQPSGKLLQTLLTHRVSVFVAHTNWDVADGGVNDQLADALGLTDTKPLQVTHTEALYQLVTYVPSKQAEHVRQALCTAGAGAWGDYVHCTFGVEGTGTFLPLAGAHPTVGHVGTLQSVTEQRLEMLVPQRVCDAVVEALMRSHPYEEVAYALLPLIIPPHSALERRLQRGLGRIGKIEPMTVGELAQIVKKTFQVPFVRRVGEATKRVERVAIMGGSGKSALADAIAQRADVYITGDIDHHTAIDAQAAGVSLLDLGHFVEHRTMERLGLWMQQRAQEEGVALQVTHSHREMSPFYLE